MLRPIIHTVPGLRSAPARQPMRPPFRSFIGLHTFDYFHSQLLSPTAALPNTYVLITQARQYRSRGHDASTGRNARS